ncbi:M56 family metallopeptidase [Erythrobacter dokdonensis]|uniref:Ankyrin-related protein n=1 Tax=Erythrobacter dokdonensis DSW-74 TaxID=1300349 RepID=A0A1A7BL32_9SPHN|nr:M56 family metallopeptidase [Erythrobacter dokdonensis]OBV12431.1 Ankyrin-related protein [Erythrobacter dokdonensis DSW-74]
MNAVLLETLAWTGVLIALVLVLRRPVARACGPQCAYALWALPLVRLLLPPLTLPAWMAPAMPAADPLPEGEVVAMPVEVVADVAPAAAGFDVFAALAGLPLAEGLLLVWLGGAGVFMCRRFAAYFTLRDDLLAEGREVGRVPGRLGAIRLVETPGTPAPLAFGVLDPVIALPPGFMALPDRRARDLALAHELAHHRGLDLLVNILVQPLFALHWFNPLGHYGWLALRRDQEAACDARVIAHATHEERAAYARLIAGFAAGPNLAIAAPMACPVLGEKSIIQRLRSLSMSNLSLRRRLVGRALLGAGLLALPLTASISYAASDPGQPAAAPTPPAPPAVAEPPSAPEPVEAPEAPAAPEVREKRSTFVFIDPDREIEEGEGLTVTRRIERGDDGKERHIRLVRIGGPQGEVIAEDQSAEGKVTWEEREAFVIEWREGMAEAGKALAEMREARRKAFAEAGAARAEAPTVMVLKDCSSSFSGEAEVIDGKGGKKTIMICQPRIPATARLGLEQARAEIASDKDIPEATRKKVLETLDRQIARWKEKEG